MSLTHTFGLLAHPDQEWEAIRNESETVTRLYAGHILLLALIPAVAGFIGTTQAHITAVFRKLGVRNRTQAVIAIQQMEIDPSDQSLSGS